MGHKLRLSNRQWGNMQVITWDFANGKVEAASDPRGEGEGLGLLAATRADCAPALALAGGAPVSRALALSELLDGRLAHAARLSGALIDK